MGPEYFIGYQIILYALYNSDNRFKEVFDKNVKEVLMTVFTED